ncbi:hypothetical protein ACOSQ4_000527 [Xanthoceras sorbifolium]
MKKHLLRRTLKQPNKPEETYIFKQDLPESQNIKIYLHDRALLTVKPIRCNSRNSDLKNTCSIHYQISAITEKQTSTSIGLERLI